MKEKYHVIIIGAGPSGLSTALNLFKLGIKDVLVIEQYKFPRYKCCAGYITNKTKKVYESLGLDIKKCHYSLIKDFNICYKLKIKSTIENKFLYTNQKIDRVELDNELYKLAVKKGINILENTKILKHSIEKNKITLNNKNTITYDYLVFADGTSGYGSKYQKTKSKNIAMQITFPSKDKDKIDIHFGITKHGYGWVSSYKGITNIGLTDVYNKNINYKNIFKKFAKELNYECNLKDLKGAFTPIGINKPIINKNIFYVGDAVGACDPLTLSGLRYGLKSGERCAVSIKEQNNNIYKCYIRKLKIKFFLMKILLKVFYLKSVLYLIFNIGCKYFNHLIAYVFNHFFINKK